MPLQQWQYTGLQSAAVEMCYRMNEQPFAEFRPGMARWEVYAQMMAEHRMMVEVMKQFGHLS